LKALDQKTFSDILIEGSTIKGRLRHANLLMRSYTGIGIGEDEPAWQPPQNMKDKALLDAWRERNIPKLYGMEAAFDLVKFEDRRREVGKFDQELIS
jgi:hypothetical protein